MLLCKNPSPGLMSPPRGGNEVRRGRCGRSLRLPKGATYRYSLRLSEPMKVLVADDDPISALVLEGLLTASGHTCQIARDGNEAWEIIQGKDPPLIMFLDWMMPGVDGLELCRRTRELKRGSYTYIVIVSARNRQEEVSLGFAAGADEFITKPYQPEEVFARQRVAERVVQTVSAENSLDKAIAEAYGSPAGDVVVRSGSVIGRIAFQGGKVTWASVSDRPDSPEAMLATDPTLDADELAAAVEESKTVGVPLTELIIEWGLLSEDKLRALIRSWICRQIAAISLLNAPVVIFSPVARNDTTPFLFDYESLTALRVVRESTSKSTHDRADHPANSPAPQLLDDTDLERARADLDQAMTLSGAISAAIFDEQTGRWLLSRGEKIDLDLAWRNVKLAGATHERDEVEDIIVTTRHHIYILRPYMRSPRRFIFLVTDRAKSRLGMVRLALASCSHT